MKTEAQEVKMTIDGEKRVVDTIDITTYDSLEEMVEALEEKVIVSAANRQLKADAMNACRAKHAPSRAGKKAKMAMAFNLASKRDPDKLRAVIGKGHAAMEALIEGYIEDVEKNIAEGRIDGSDAAQNSMSTILMACDELVSTRQLITTFKDN